MAQSSFETAPTRLNPRQFLCSRNPNREAAGQSRLWHATEKATVVSSLSSGWFFSVKMIHAILVERSHQRTVSFEAKIYKSTPRLSSSVKKPLDCWRSLMAWNRGRQRDCGNLWYVQICPDIQLYAISISVQRQSVKSIGIIDVHWCSLMFIVSLCFCFPTLRSCREDSASSSVSILSESLECHKWCLNLNADVLSVQNALFALSVWDLSPPFRLFRMQCSRLWQYRRPLPCSSNFVKPRAKVEQSCQVTKTTKEVAKKWRNLTWNSYWEVQFGRSRRWSRRWFRWCLKKFGIFPGSDESSRSSCPSGLVDPHFSIAQSCWFHTHYKPVH